MSSEHPGAGAGSDLQELARTLGVEVADIGYLSDLEASVVRRLDAAVATTVATEEAAIDEALQRTLRFLPRLLRGPAKAVLFPDGE